jgi:hypothetical protein
MTDKTQYRLYEWMKLANHADLLFITLLNSLTITEEQHKVIRNWQKKYDELFDKDDVDEQPSTVQD